MVCKISQSLLQFVFSQSKSDFSLFTEGLGSTFVALLMYVDNTIIIGSNQSIIDSFKQFLHSKFKLKDLGPLKYFLGIELARSSKGLVLSQRHYTLQLLEDTSFLASKPTSLPMDPKASLNATNGDPLHDSSQYRRLIGRLLYLTLFHPDITYVVHKLSQFSSNPCELHLKDVHHLLQYLKQSPSQGLFFLALSSLQIKAFTNADWGSCSDSRKSTTGFCIFLGDSLVSWKSKKQPTISHSSTKVEYRAMATTTFKLLWLQQLLADFVVPLDQPMLLFCDNQAAIHIGTNSTFYERTKHIEIDYHFVKDNVTVGVLRLMPIRTQHQLADFSPSLCHPRLSFHS